MMNSISVLVQLKSFFFDVEFNFNFSWPKIILSLMGMHILKTLLITKWSTCYKFIAALTLEAVTSVDINTDEVSTTPKIKCANESCEKLCCPCTGDTCQNLCRSNSFKYLVKRSLCYKICCAVELRNITEVPEIVNIPHGEVILLIQDTDIQIIRDYSLKITYNWEEIEITFCKITTIQLQCV